MTVTIQTVMEELLTKQQVADRFQISTRWIERQIAAGKLRPVRFSHKVIRFRESDLEAFVSQFVSPRGAWIEPE